MSADELMAYAWPSRCPWWPPSAKYDATLNGIGRAQAVDQRAGGSLCIGRDRDHPGRISTWTVGALSGPSLQVDLVRAEVVLKILALQFIMSDGI